MQKSARANLDVVPATRPSSVDRKTKLPVRKLKAFALVAMHLLAFYSLASDAVWLRFLPTLTTGLTKIGEVRNLEGAALRKTVVDSLWLPLRSDSQVFDSDLISTGDGDRIEIAMGEVTVTIEPNTLVRIKSIDGKALLRLAGGSLKLHSDSNQTVKIQRGSKVEDLEIAKGNYALNADTLFGVQITGFNQSAKAAKLEQPTNSGSAEKGTSTAERGGPDTDGDDEPEATDAVATVPPIPPGSIRFDLPTPKDNTQFLIRQPHRILVAAQSVCPDTCVLTIFKNQIEWRSVNFKEGQSAAVTIEPSELSNGRYNWIYKTNSIEIQAHFVVDGYSDDKLLSAVESGHPVEVF